MKRTKRGYIVILTALMVLGFPTLPSHAQERSTSNPARNYGSQKPADTWQFTIAPYAWLVGISGDITIRDRTTHVSVPFNDIWNNLDFGAQVQIEARKGRWGMFLQPNYLKLSPTASLSRPAATDILTGGSAVREADIRLTSKIWITEFGGFYRLLEDRVADGNKQGSVSVDVLIGGRYWYTENRISLSLPQRGVGFRETSYGNVIDPMIGFRTAIYLFPKVYITLRGDAAGFGVSTNSSHISWNGVGTLGFDVSPCLAAGAGYRYLYINYSGSGDWRIKANIQGPLVGVEYTF